MTQQQKTTPLDCQSNIQPGLSANRHMRCPLLFLPEKDLFQLILDAVFEFIIFDGVVRIAQPASDAQSVSPVEDSPHPYFSTYAVSNEEIFILHLMYRDLADRTV